MGGRMTTMGTGVTANLSKSAESQQSRGRIGPGAVIASAPTTSGRMPAGGAIDQPIRDLLRRSMATRWALRAQLAATLTGPDGLASPWQRRLALNHAAPQRYNPIRPSIRFGHSGSTRVVICARLDSSTIRCRRRRHRPLREAKHLQTRRIRRLSSSPHIASAHAICPSKLSDVAMVR